MLTRTAAKFTVHEILQNGLAESTELELPNGHVFKPDSVRKGYRWKNRRFDLVYKGFVEKGPLSVALQGQRISLIVEVGVWSLKDDAFKKDIEGLNALAMEIDVLRYPAKNLRQRWIPTKLLERSVRRDCVDIECGIALAAAWRDAPTHCSCCGLEFDPQQPWHDECKRCWRACGQYDRQSWHDMEILEYHPAGVRRLASFLVSGLPIKKAFVGKKVYKSHSKPSSVSSDKPVKR